MLGPQAELGLTTRLRLELQLWNADHIPRERNIDVLAAEAPAVGRGLERASDQVHGRGAEERRDEDVGRSAIDLLRRSDLLQHSVAHHRDPMAHRHRLDLVVRHVHGRDPEPLVELDQLEARLHAELRVEVGERLVHEERVRLAHDGAGEGDALALPARQLPRQALQQVFEPENPRRPSDRRLDLVLPFLRDLQRERDVLEHGHVRIQRVVLEHHRDIALHGVDEVHEPAADHDLTRVGILEPRDDSQDRALPAPRRPEQDEELAVCDLQRDVVDRLDLAEALHQMLDHDVCHYAASPACTGREIIA